MRSHGRSVIDQSIILMAMTSSSLNLPRGGSPKNVAARTSLNGLTSDSGQHDCVRRHTCAPREPIARVGHGFHACTLHTKLTAFTAYTWEWKL